nr:metal transporter Nramp5 [Tanacetum cinerariifolium]
MLLPRIIYEILQLVEAVECTEIEKLTTKIQAIKKGKTKRKELLAINGKAIELGNLLERQHSQSLKHERDRIDRPFALGFLTPFTGELYLLPSGRASFDSSPFNRASFYPSSSIALCVRGALGFQGIGFSPMFALLKLTFSLQPLQLALPALKQCFTPRCPVNYGASMHLGENLLALGSSGISPNHNSSADSSTSVGSDLHLVSTKRHPGHG